jgi:hypothetical protein
MFLPEFGQTGMICPTIECRRCRGGAGNGGGAMGSPQAAAVILWVWRLPLSDSVKFVTTVLRWLGGYS